MRNALHYFIPLGGTLFGAGPPPVGEFWLAQFGGSMKLTTGPFKLSLRLTTSRPLWETAEPGWLAPSRFISTFYVASEAAYG